MTSHVSHVRRNVSPNVWGPPTWALLHACAQGYSNTPTPEERRAFANLLDALPHVLPCTSCRNNVVKELAAMPYAPALASTRAILEYVNALQNSVSARLGKPTWTLNAALRHYRLDTTSAAGESCGTRNDLPPAVWADKAWDVMTAVAFAFPDDPSPQEQRALKDFFTSLAVLLPDEDFRKRFAAQLALREPATQTARDAGEWLGQLKTSFDGKPVEYETMVKKLFKSDGLKAGNNSGNLSTRDIGLISGVIVLFIAFIVVLILATLKRRSNCPRVT